MNLKQILDQTPRLRDWYNIGPVQRAELEQFAQLLLNSQHTAITSDGVLVKTGADVWVLNGFGTPTQTTVRNTEPVTSYYLFGQIPVAHSFSTRQAAEQYQKANV